MEKAIMAIGAHADDLEIAVGGTLVKYYSLGYKIFYILTTNNMSGNWCRIRKDGTIDYTRPPCDIMMRQRKLEAGAAADFLGTAPLHLDYPQRHYFNKDGIQVDLTYGGERPDCVPAAKPSILTAPDSKDCIENLADFILKENPEAVLTFGPLVVNIEHFATGLLATKAYWQAVKSGYEGMLLNWLDITPSIFGVKFSRWDTFVDISDYHGKKLEAISFHASQAPKPETLELPLYGPACGCKYAETFTVTSSGAPNSVYTPFKMEIINNMK